MSILCPSCQCRGDRLTRQQALLALCTVALAIGALVGLSSVFPNANVAANRAVAVASASGAPARLAGAPGCDPARAHDAGDFDQTITSGDLTRSFILRVPPSYEGDIPTPVVLNLHGLGGGAAQHADYSELPAKADEEGFILVTPQGVSTEFLSSSHWNFLRFLPFAPDDVLFIDDLLDDIGSQLCIDGSRIFAAGISMGAMMATRLGCDLSDRIAAIAPVAGVYFPPWSPDLAVEADCVSARPGPVVAFHGTADTIVPFEGGPVGLQGFSFTLRNIELDVMPSWAEQNGCQGDPTEEPVTEQVTLVQYDGCNADATVQLYIIDGGRHDWPGARGRDDEISASDLMWEFFLEHPLAYLAGDANCDGSVNSIDASLVLQQSAGLLATVSCPSEADVNGDGVIDSLDAALLLQHDAGLLPELPS